MFWLMDYLHRSILKLCCFRFFSSQLQVQENKISVRDALTIALQNNLELNRVIEQIEIEKSEENSDYSVDNTDLKNPE